VNRRILVAGIGNIFLADDGFGCEVVRRLTAEPLPAGVELVDYGIRGMHLAFDLLGGYDALVIVDAAPRGGSPGDLSVLEVGPDDLGTGELDAHGMEPTAVLGSLGTLGGELPRTLVVCCEPAELEERMGLSAAVAAAVPPAVSLVRDLLEEELGLTPPVPQHDAVSTSVPTP
jgi:hydrogenase maturation protease